MALQPSNLLLRVATAVVGLPVILALVYLAPPWAFYLLVLAASLVAEWELFVMTHPADRVSQAAGLAVSGLASIAVYAGAEDARVLVGVLVIVPLAGLIFTLARLGPLATAALRAFALGVGPLLVAVPLALLAVLRRTTGGGGAGAGSGAVLLALGLAWFADTGAYFAGRAFGRHKLYPAVSPNKTIEGAVGGLIASIVWAVLGAVGYLRGLLPLSHALALGVVGGALGQAGDLGESLLKRSMGVKDSGHLVPGHGGVLDRVDALLMTSVTVFFYAEWVGWR